MPCVDCCSRHRDLPIIDKLVLSSASRCALKIVARVRWLFNEGRSFTPPATTIIIVVIIKIGIVDFKNLVAGPETFVLLVTDFTQNALHVVPSKHFHPRVWNRAKFRRLWNLKHVPVKGLCSWCPNLSTCRQRLLVPSHLTKFVHDQSITIQWQETQSEDVY